MLLTLSPSILIVVALLGAHHEAEALGQVQVLHALLNHQAALGSKRHHSWEQSKCLDLEVVRSKSGKLVKIAMFG